VGLTFSPARIRADATAALVAGYRGGSAWRFADARSAAAFLDAASRAGSVREGRAPDVRWHALGGRADAAAGVAVAELTRAGLTVAAAGAIGLRDDGDRRTLTLDMGIDELDLAADVPGFPAGPGDQHAWVADVTWERGELRELALRTATRTSERVEEYSAVLDLSEPGNRAAAARLLRPGSSTPVALAALAARIASHGVVQRDGYSVTERRRGFGIAGKLGVALGLEHQRITSERRLVDAVAWVRGGPPQRRFDCLGV
jgi:hypothetical protein